MSEQARLCELLVAASGGTTMTSKGIESQLTPSGPMYQATAKSLGYFGLCAACRFYVNAEAAGPLLTPPDCLGIRPEGPSQA